MPTFKPYPNILASTAKPKDQFKASIMAANDFELMLNASLAQQSHPLPVIITAKMFAPSVSSRPKLLSTIRPTVVFAPTPTTPGPTQSPTSVTQRPNTPTTGPTNRWPTSTSVKVTPTSPPSVRPNVSLAEAATSIPVATTIHDHDRAQASLRPETNISKNETETVEKFIKATEEFVSRDKEDNLDGAISFIKTVSNFLLRSNETSVVLSNGSQKLNFSVPRHKVLSLFGVFSDMNFEESKRR